MRKRGNGNGLRFVILAAASVIYFSVAITAFGQTTPTDSSPAPTPPKRSISATNEKLFLRHLLEDQRELWLSPLHMKPHDAKWAIPMAGITTGLIMTDRTSSAELARSGWGTSASNVGLAAYGGTVAAFYLLGARHGDPRARETGLLAAEAGLNSLIIGEVLKPVFRRDRPFTGDGTGHFFRPGGSSFYSIHSTIAWSFAGVIAHEYPGWLSQMLAYGAATGISLSRVAGQQHFPSDVFVGAVTGYLTGRQVYRKRHDRNLDIEFGTFEHSHPEWSSKNAGTTYIPLDSWIYPVLERLIAAGYVRYQFLGMRPWTRTAVADMIAEAVYRIGSENSVPAGVSSATAALQQEFSDESRLGSAFDNEAIRLESVYTRATVISGPPLNDSYHFGQTLINDFGRPYQRGFNNVTGFTARAETGRFAFYVRGEYQHAPSADAYPLSVRQVIAQADATPLQPASPIAEVNSFRLLDTYVAATVAGHVVSVGKQSLWWGPGEGDAMIFSDNAEPFYLLRINRAVPLKLPFILKYLGPVRYDAFFGRLAGHQFPPRPFMHGEKFSFKPTENLEFGFSRTAIFAGEGLTPLTFGNFWESLTSTTSSTNPGFDLRRSPGVRHSSFDLSYRVPGLRKWLTLYTDSLVHDDVSPIDAPRRAAVNPGIYLSHVPRFTRLDLRIEAVNTDPPIPESNGGSFIYYESFYKDLYLNKSKLLGSWIGREGKGLQAWSTYWLGPLSTIQVSYRNAKVAKDFIPGGETANTFAMRTMFRVKPELELSSYLQYERWKAPVLATGLQSDFTASFQLTYWPRQWKAVSR